MCTESAEQWTILNTVKSLVEIKACHLVAGLFEAARSHEEIAVLEAEHLDLRLHEALTKLQAVMGGAAMEGRLFCRPANANAAAWLQLLRRIEPILVGFQVSRCRPHTSCEPAQNTHTHTHVEAQRNQPGPDHHLATPRIRWDEMKWR